MAEYNQVRCESGSYNWLDPGDTKNIQVVFTWRDDAPEEIKQKRGIVAWKVGDGPDRFESAIDAIEELKCWVDRCWLNSEKEWIYKAYDYLWSVVQQDEVARLTVRKRKLEIELAGVIDRIARIQMGDY